MSEDQNLYRAVETLASYALRLIEITPYRLPSIQSMHFDLLEEFKPKN